MQSKLIQELYKHTKRLVGEMFPEAVLLKPDNFPNSWRLWRLNSEDKLKIFLILAPSPKDDSFALEIAWTVHDKLPEYNGLHPDEDPGKGEMCFRLSCFWQRYGAEHRWHLGSKCGAEAMRPRAVEIPAGLDFPLKMPGNPNDPDFVNKLRELGLDVAVPIVATLEEKFQTVAPQIEDAFSKLKQYGVPYLKQIAARYDAELKVALPRI